MREKLNFHMVFHIYYLDELQIRVYRRLKRALWGSNLTVESDALVSSSKTPNLADVDAKWKGCLLWHSIWLFTESHVGGYWGHKSGPSV